MEVARVRMLPGEGSKVPVTVLRLDLSVEVTSQGVGLSPLFSPTSRPQEGSSVCARL